MDSKLYLTVYVTEWSEREREIPIALRRRRLVAITVLCRLAFGAYAKRSAGVSFARGSRSTINLIEIMCFHR